MKKFTFYLVMIFCCFVNFSMAQNIGINPESSLPHPSAGLDINFTDKGLLIPRVSLVNTTSASPVTDPAVSLLVYNTATAGDVTPGYYFWNGTAWSRLSASLDGSGTANYFPKWTGTNTLGSSQVYDDGTNVGIGTATPGAKLEVAGDLKIADGTQGANKILTSDTNGLASWQNSELTQMASVPCQSANYYLSASIATEDTPYSVAVSGNYAYVVNVGSNTMQIFDVTTPYSPSLAGSIGTGSLPYSVTVSGNYAYVVNVGSNTMQIFDISTPSGPNLTGSISTDSNPWSVAVSGNYAYVVNHYSNTLQIFNVSMPSSPSLVGSVGTGSHPLSVAVSGNYAYVVNSASNSLQIFDVTTPSSPILAGSMGTGSVPSSVTVSGNFAYVVNVGSNTMQIFDVTTPSSPSLAGSICTGSSPYCVTVSGNLAYVVNTSSNSMQIFNVTDPYGPILAGSVVTGDIPFSSAVSGNCAYIVNIGSDNLQIFQNLCARQDLIIENDDVILSSPIWQISNANIFNTNTGNIGIGISIPGQLLDVFGGNIRTNQQLISTVATGTSPLGISSTTQVSNLNTDLLDGQHADGFIKNQTASDQSADFRINGNGIFNGGNVGIGVISPAKRLDVSGELQTTGTGNNYFAGKIGIGVASPAKKLDVSGEIQATGTGNNYFAGNVGIGTSNPVNKLQLGGNLHMVGNTMYFANTATDHYHLIRKSITFDGIEIGGYNGVVLGYTNSASNVVAPTLTVKNNYVGIGTQDPKAPLHIAVATSSTPFGASNVYYDKMTFIDLPSVSFGGLNGVNASVSLVAEGDIVCKGTLTVTQAIYFSSDKRLKNISGTSNSLKDLDILKKIQVTDYTMKDYVTWGFASYKKAIAQQVEEVYPQAVTKTTGFIPDIYAFALKVEKTDGGYLVTMEKSLSCKVGDKIRLELENKGTVEAIVLSVLNDKQFEVATETDISKGELFVYGKEVSDLRQVDYDAISMLNVSATQELARQLKEAQERIEELNKQNQQLKAQIGEIREFLGMKAEK